MANDERDRTSPDERPDGTGTKPAGGGAASGYDGGGLSNTGEITGAGGGAGTADAANAPHDRPQAGSPAPEDVRSDAP
ncbi:MAG TPA: hypothetical protein VHS78_03630 [Candidatus Elarobacter sp.]|jgi:hypothetical protein|nr:hypothetical protein [Candidatus Elarobacter sp.]